MSYVCVNFCILTDTPAPAVSPSHPIEQILRSIAGTKEGSVRIILIYGIDLIGVTL